MAKRDKSSSDMRDGTTAVAGTDKGTRRTIARPRNENETMTDVIKPAGSPPAPDMRRANGSAPQNSTMHTGDNVDIMEVEATGIIPPAPKQQRADLDIEHFRNLLFQERSNLEGERDALRARGQDMDGAIPEDGEAGEEDTADLATAIMDKEFDLSVEDELEESLAQVERALQKIDEGTYGICDMSGNPIPASRLELIPYATLTAENQALSEGEG